MLHSFSKITRFFYHTEHMTQKSNVDLVLLVDIFQTQFIKYSSQICSSSSNYSSSNTVAIKHTYIQSNHCRLQDVLISCRCSQFSSNHQVSCLGLGGTAYKGSDEPVMWQQVNRADVT